MPEMTRKLSALLQKEPFVILDGALATHLESVGHDFNNALWSASLLVQSSQRSISSYEAGIEDIIAAHEAYYLAGANIATTATYQASIAGLIKYGDLGEHHANQCIETAVRAAQTARDRVVAANPNLDRSSLLVAGSVGPYGAFLADGAEYTGAYGDMSEQDLIDFHRPRMVQLTWQKVDCLALETVPSFKEAIALAKLLKEFPDFDAWMSFTLKDREHIADGTPLKDVIDGLHDYEQIAAVGVNCMPPGITDEALESLENLMTDKCLVAYPNSGEGYDASTKQWAVGVSHDIALDHLAIKWAQKGVRIIGGCCRTTPENIKSIRNSLDFLSISR